MEKKVNIWGVWALCQAKLLSYFLRFFWVSLENFLVFFLFLLILQPNFLIKRFLIKKKTCTYPIHTHTLDIGLMIRIRLHLKRKLWPPPHLWPFEFWIISVPGEMMVWYELSTSEEYGTGRVVMTSDFVSKLVTEYL